MKTYKTHLTTLVAAGVLFLAAALTSCGGPEKTEEEKAVEEQEIQNVDSMVKSDQEKMDSVRKSLGI